MEEFQDDHRGHTIFCHASGPSDGPWVAGFSAWKIEPNNSYRAVIQGALPIEYESPKDAQAAAAEEAKKKLDVLLDEK